MLGLKLNHVIKGGHWHSASAQDINPYNLFQSNASRITATSAVGQRVEYIVVGPFMEIINVTCIIRFYWAILQQ